MSGAPVPRDATVHWKGGVDYRRIAEAAVLPVRARRLRAPRVAWINHRWFAANGIDVTHPAHERLVEEWLVDNFAFQIPHAHDPADAFCDEQRTFYADRYGGGGLGSNGGSGRCAALGGFQVKGIGATPLVGALQDEVHSHGAATLEEGIREAILSEIAAAEFPHGTAPVIAVIETRTRLVWKQGPVASEPRALIVRVNIVRGGHLERAVRFLPQRFSKFDHLADVERVRAYIRAFLDPDAVGLTPSFSVRSLAGFERAIAAQMAFGFVHRFSIATYTSSNVGMDGQVLDFGGTRAMPSWELAYTAKGMPPFGHEAVALGTIVDSIGFYMAKYAGTGNRQPNEAASIRRARASIEQSIGEELRRLVGDCVDEPGFAAELCGALRELFRSQQATYHNYFVKNPGLGGELWLCRLARELAGASRGEQTPEQGAAEPGGEFAMRLRDLARRDRRYRTAVLRVAQVLTPRLALDRENLQQWIYAELVSTTDVEGVPPGTIRAAIDRKISENRRVWRDIPANCAVLAQVVSGGCAALLLQDELGAYAFWIEAPVIDGCLACFGRTVPLRTLGHACTPGRDGVARLKVACADDPWRCPATLRIGGEEIELPPLQLYFRDADRTRAGS